MHSRLSFILACVCMHISGNVSAQTNNAVDTDIRRVHQYLADSHHRPLCVLIRKAGSQLERRVMKLWSNRTQANNGHFTSWALAAVTITQVKSVPRYLLKNSQTRESAFLRCFLGPTLSHDFDPSGPPTGKQLQQWFGQLMVEHRQLVNGSADMIEASVGHHRFTLVVFPTTQQHEELEQAAFQITEALSNECEINIIIIHPSSANLRDILKTYKVTNLPSVLLIEKETGMVRRQQLFNIHEVMTGQMETDMRSRLIAAQHFTVSDFELGVLKVQPANHYSPYLIGFYVHWEKETAVFLSFLRQAVLEFKSLGADLRFGLVDAAHNPTVLSHYMTPQCLQHLPFLALFSTEEGKMTVNQTELLVTRPTPYTIYSALREVGHVLTDSQQQPITYQPYGLNTQVCLWREGPWGDLCSSSDNTTCFFSDDCLHSEELQDTAITEEETEPIPLATQADWHTFVDTSDTDVDVPMFINIFIFIRHPCKSCEQNQAHFQHIYQQLSANDSYRVRLVNCSLTPEPCEQHHVTGFPTVLAFRWHRTLPKCATTCSEKSDCDQYVRQDYHGVLTVSALMDWISSVSVQPVQALYFNKPDWKRKESAQLVATLVPLDSGYLPLPPDRNKGYFYSIHCFREVCEQLFGLVTCFTVNSADIPPSQFDSHSMNRAIIQVDFRRRDGIEVTLMQLGQSLDDLLDQETDHALHMFHAPHSYKLGRKQKCEEDHGGCTRFLEAFTRDHMRLPVTSLTSDILHSHNDFLFGKQMPVLLALVEPDYTVEFHEALQNIAYTFYKDIVVATLDVSAYRAWAGSFVPRNYNRLHAESSSWGELGVYPRLCLFYWHDHTKAAFYPPVKATASYPVDQRLDISSSNDELLTEDLIAHFVQHFLQDPASNLIETERF